MFSEQGLIITTAHTVVDVEKLQVSPVYHAQRKEVRSSLQVQLTLWIYVWICLVKLLLVKMIGYDSHEPWSDVRRSTSQDGVASVTLSCQVWHFQSSRCWGLCLVGWQHLFNGNNQVSFVFQYFAVFFFFDVSDKFRFVSFFFKLS